MNDRKRVQSSAMPAWFITVYLDGSGGYFSKRDGKPVSLWELTGGDQETIDILNKEYANLYRNVTGENA